MACCCKLNFNVDVIQCLSALWLLSRPNSGENKLEDVTAQVKARREDIQNKIAEAALEGKIPTNEVTNWLAGVNELEDGVEGIKRDFENMSCFSCNCTSSQTQQEEDITLGKSSNCCSIIIRTAEKLGEAEELLSRKLDSIAGFRLLEPTVMLPISHQPPIGIESYVDDIVNYIDGGEGKIIGIYGMGGVGKTTILDNVERHYLEYII